MNQSAPEFQVENVALPGLPDDVGFAYFDAWTAGLLRGAIAAIATHVGVAAGDLLPRVTCATEASAEKAREESENAQRIVARLRNDRMLLAEPNLAKLIRYEAHLHRQLLQTMHEIEALQARRQGQVAPLARVDVQGLPEN